MLLHAVPTLKGSTPAPLPLTYTLDRCLSRFAFRMFESVGILVQLMCSHAKLATRLTPLGRRAFYLCEDVDRFFECKPAIRSNGHNSVNGSRRPCLFRDPGFEVAHSLW